MRLYVLDNDIDNPIALSLPIKDDYDAERHVINIAEGREGNSGPPLLGFFLCDEKGIRCIWARNINQAIAQKLPAVVRVTDRYQGKWERQVDAVDRIDPHDPYERIVHARHFRVPSSGAVS